MYRILLTAFEDTSAEQLIRGSNHPTLTLPNSKIRDAQKLIFELRSAEYDYVISFGQRPNIKNRVHIETTARNGSSRIDTRFDVIRFQNLFETRGIPAKISQNAGTSFCNSLYWNGLNFIAENAVKTSMVFVHIPFMKNIENFHLFKENIRRVIDEWKG